MNDPHKDRAHFTHLFSSPLTSLRGAIDLLRAPNRVADDPVTRELLGTLERSYTRLRSVLDTLLEHCTLAGDEVQIVAPLSAFGIAQQQEPASTPATPDIIPPQPMLSPPLERGVPDRPASKTVLLVAGSLSELHTVSVVLREAGYTVLETGDYIQGLDMARNYHPDLILLHSGLLAPGAPPVMRVLREDPETKAIPILCGVGEHQPPAPLPEQVETVSLNAPPADLLAVVGQTIEAARVQAALIPTLLIVDDDPDIQRIVSLKLLQDGYRIVTAATGTEGLIQAQKQPFDLIILDLLLPDLDGFAVLGALRARSATATTPIILLSARDSAQEKVHGFQLGADDYVTKPFSGAELQARVRAALRRHEREAGANPSTRLPGNIAIEQVIRRRIEQNAPFAVCYADLDNFKAYNDTYSFLKGDAVIQQTAHVLLAAVEQLGNSGDFVGHIGGDDFIVITTPDRAEPICAGAIANFDALAPLLYDPETRQRGYINAVDRQRRPVTYPFVSLSFGIVSSARHPIQHLAEVAQRAVEPKKRAKEIHGSVYVLEE